MKDEPMRKLSRPAIYLLLCMLLTNVQAEDFSDLEGSEHSPTFTSAERRLFVDAVGQFKKHEIPPKYFNGSAFWLDDDHLVFSSREYPGWKAALDEVPQIVIYDVNTGDIKDSGYRGRLDCLNHLGDFMLSLPIKPEGFGFYPENYRWFIGRWGQPPQEITYDRWAAMPTYLCRFAPRGQPIHHYPPEDLSSDAAQLTPLLPGHGVLRNTVAREGGQIIDYLHLVKEDGTKIYIRNSPIRQGSLVFQPWSNSYFENGTTDIPPTSLALTGITKIHKMPRLLQFWISRHVARGGVFNSRPGLLWTVRTSRGLWKKQGVFLDTHTELLRVSDTSVTGQMTISPNGCKAFWGAYIGDSFKPSARHAVFVMDICKEGETK